MAFSMAVNAHLTQQQVIEWKTFSRSTQKQKAQFSAVVNGIWGDILGDFNQQKHFHRESTKINPGQFLQGVSNRPL